MKIVCIGRNLGMGGMERQLSGLACMLQDMGHETTMLTYREEKDFFGSEMEACGVRRMKLIKGRAESTLGFERRLSRFLAEIGPDVVIAYGQGPSRKACVARMMNPSFRLIVSERNANPRLNVFDAYKMLLYRLSSEKIMTNSYAQASLLGKAFPKVREKLVIVPNFVDSGHFVPAARPSGEIFTIITTARVAHRKNILKYIKAVRRALDNGADFRVLWYGRRPDSKRYCSKCDSLIEKLGLKDRFLLLDAVADTQAVYVKADAFCLPSIYEGTSNSLAEALSCALPVICSDAGDNLRYVRESVNGFSFDAGDIDSIASAIENIVRTSSAQRENMGRESRRIAVEELGADEFRKRISRLVQP